jgi:hypothetical protein
MHLIRVTSNRGKCWVSSSWEGERGEVKRWTRMRKVDISRATPLGELDNGKLILSLRNILPRLGREESDRRHERISEIYAGGGLARSAENSIWPRKAFHSELDIPL